MIGTITTMMMLRSQRSSGYPLVYTAVARSLIPGTLGTIPPRFSFEQTLSVLYYSKVCSTACVKKLVGY